MRARSGVDVGVQDVFELATVSALAAHLDAISAGEGGPTRAGIVAIPHDGPLQMSAAQLRQWFQFRIDGPNPVNNIPFAARLTGPCDIEAFVAAINDVVDRHEILRTTYREIDGAPYQVVNPAEALTVRRARGDGDDWLQTELDTERRYCFDLERDWPIRAAVLSTPEAHVLSLVVHHIAADHWSAGVLFTDVLAAYHSRRAGQTTSALAPLPVQYADFAAWQARLLAEEGEAREKMAAQRDYWTKQLGRPARGERAAPGLPPPAGAYRRGRPPWTSPSKRRPGPSWSRSPASSASPSSCCCRPRSPSPCTRPVKASTFRWALRSRAAPNRNSTS